MPRTKYTPQNSVSLSEIATVLREYAATLEASADSLKRQSVDVVEVGGDIDAGLERLATFVRNARKTATTAGRPELDPP